VRTWWDQCRCRKAPRARMPSWLTHCVAWSMSPACWSDSQSSWSRASPFPWLDQDVPAHRLDWSQLLVFDSPPSSIYIFCNIWIQLYVYNHGKCSGAWVIAKIMRIELMEIAPTHCGAWYSANQEISWWIFVVQEYIHALVKSWSYREGCQQRIYSLGAGVSLCQ